MTRVFLTVDGAEKLRGELARLIRAERPRVIEAIAEARSHGDLSENAEYEAARDEQGFIEGRIAELEDQLARAEIVDPKKLHIEGKVVFGALVDLFDVDADTEVTYQIVGELEADLEHGRISMSSPIGRALIGKKEGEELEVVTPGGTRGYEIIKVRYE